MERADGQAVIEPKRRQSHLEPCHFWSRLVPALSGARALERTPIDSRESARGVWDICAAMGERGA